MKLCLGEKTVKTGGWAAISGVLFFGSGLASGAELGPIVMATIIAVSLKTPFYWAWEHAFEYLWHRGTPKPQTCCYNALEE